MSKEAANVEILKVAYGKWHETKGGSVDHFLAMSDPEISFGSVPRGAAPLAFAKQYDNREAVNAYFDGLPGRLGDGALHDRRIHRTGR